MTLIETIKFFNGNFFYLDFHQWRIDWSLEKLSGNKIKLFDVLSNSLKNIKLNSDEVYRCRVSYNKYQIVNIEYIKYIEKNIETVAIINAEKLEYNLKFADRSEINKLINAHCDETIFVKNNLLTDFSIGNIAIKYNDIWQTPTKPLLKGTTRERYLRSGFLQEQDISLNEFMNLFNNKNLEIAIINSMLDFKQLKIKKLVNQI